MADAMTVSWRGGRYEVVRKNAGDSGEPGTVWQVMHDGALLTSFPAEDGDGAGEVKEKVTGWLEANHGRPAADVGRQ